MGHNLMRLLRLLPAALLLTLPAQAAGTIKVLYTFSGGADGGAPEGSLIEDAKGNLYGTASVGGDLKCSPPLGCGTVFKLTTANKLIVLHTFLGGTDGASPYGALLMDASGNLYGTTTAGGEAKGCFGNGCGTVFKIDPTGKETVLYRFQGKTDGGLPYSSLIMDTAGNFYGTTLWGGDLSCGLGSSGCGTVFKLTKAGKETVLYKFKGGTDGAYPERETLVMDSTENLYGTASQGGDLSCNSPNGCGTVFMLAKTGKETVLHAFTGVADGSFPESGVALVNGGLYGTALAGGKYNLGTFYSINLAAADLENPLAGSGFTDEYDWRGYPKDGGAPSAAPAPSVTNAILFFYLLLGRGGTSDEGVYVFLHRLENGNFKESEVTSFNSSVTGSAPLGSPLVDTERKRVFFTTSQEGPEDNGSPYGTICADAF
jgi:uncharacterized repeat protein (TIGR03803 family)